MARRIQKSYTDYGFGFPIVLMDVPMVKIRNIWTPDIDYNLLQTGALQALAFKPARLSGNEVKFIRHSFEMTLKEFAKRFDVSHPAVLKWEKQAGKPTKMSWSLEKDIRLFVIDQQDRKKGKEKMLSVLYHELKEPKSRKPKKTSLDYHALSVA